MSRWIVGVALGTLFVACSFEENEITEPQVDPRIPGSVITSPQPLFGAFDIDIDEIDDPEFLKAREEWERIEDIVSPHYIYGVRSGLWSEAMVNPVEFKSLSVGAGVDRALWERVIREKVMQWLAPLRGMPTACPLDAYGNCILPGGPIPTQTRMSGGRLRVYVYPEYGRSYYYWWSTWRWWPPGFDYHYKIVLYQGPSYEPHDGDVMLHELGHAFGLKDTYVENGPGCVSGQPESVMCCSYHLMDGNLMTDDIQGIRYAYCLNTQRCNPNAYRY